MKCPNFTSVLFLWSHQATGPVRLDTAVYLWFGWIIRMTPRVPSGVPVRASYGSRTGIFNVFHILWDPFTGCLKSLNPYSARKLIMHALKLYGPRTGRQNSYGAARVPCGPREWTYDFCSKQPVNSPYGARERDVTEALGVKSVGGCYSDEMRRPAIRSTAHSPIQSSRSQPAFQRSRVPGTVLIISFLSIGWWMYHSSHHSVPLLNQIDDFADADPKRCSSLSSCCHHVGLCETDEDEWKRW